MSDGTWWDSVPLRAPDDVQLGQPDDVVINPIRLAIFCAVAERKNFTHAAETLGLSQPAVSGHIRALEQTLGVALFERRQRGAELTEAGRLVYDFAIGVRRSLKALRSELRALTGGQSGTVTVAASEMAGSYLLPEITARFRQRHVGAQVVVRVLPPDLVGEEVLADQADFGVVSQACTVPRSLHVDRLWIERLLLVAPSGHRLARQCPVTTTDLVGEPFISGPARAATDSALLRAGLPGKQVVMEFGTQEGVKQAVLAGMGLALLFERVVAAELATGALVALPVDELTSTQQFVLLSHPARGFSPLARNFAQFLRLHVGPSAQSRVATS